MAKLYKKTDRITVKIDGIKLKLAPLDFSQKCEIQDMMANGHVTKNYPLLQKAISTSIKYCLKDISGVEDADGNPYKLSFEENGYLTDDCVSDLYNLEMHPKLVMVCSTLVRVVPTVFKDNDGNPIKGVQIIQNEKKEKADPN